jgi:hypothetical protein
MLLDNRYVKVVNNSEPCRIWNRIKKIEKDATLDLRIEVYMIEIGVYVDILSLYVLIIF